MSSNRKPYTREKDAWSRNRMGGRKATSEERAWFLLKGKGLFDMADAFEQVQRDGVIVNDIRVKPNRENTGYVTIVKGTYEGQKIVAFHGGETVVDALAGTGEKLHKGAMKWREDEFARKAAREAKHTDE